MPHAVLFDRKDRPLNCGEHVGIVNFMIHLRREVCNIWKFVNGLFTCKAPVNASEIADDSDTLGIRGMREKYPA